MEEVPRKLGSDSVNLLECSQKKKDQNGITVFGFACAQDVIMIVS